MTGMEASDFTWDDGDLQDAIEQHAWDMDRDCREELVDKINRQVRDAWDAGRDEGYDAGREGGYEDGHAAGYSDAETELRAEINDAELMQRFICDLTDELRARGMVVAELLPSWGARELREATGEIAV